ncbi:MAG: cobalt-precorrin 5A hydrolase [Methanolinea sp.]|jgi:cobalt-precorrin 5A hydrolase|nr:cobalt-precorrin 5A hydrolase [Methanolinea sp.]
MKGSVIALERFLSPARRIAEYLDGNLVVFSRDAFASAFRDSPWIVAVMATGIATRAIAPLLRDKWHDPAVVVVDPDLSFAIPLIGGHHGANDLARRLAGLGAVPVITTATDRAGKESVEAAATRAGCSILNRESTLPVNAAILDGEVPIYTVSGPSMVIAGPRVAILFRKGEYSVGIGCRRGTGAESVREALEKAFEMAGIEKEDVGIYASTVKKAHEQGIIGGVRALGGTIVFLEDSVLAAYPPASPSRAGSVGLAGVAEPAALAVSEKKELIMKKTVFGGVTVAIAR